MTQSRRSTLRLDETRVARMPLFDGADRAALHAILESASIRRVGPGTVLFTEEDRASIFCLVVEGFVRLLRTTADGEQVVVHHVAPGELFGIAVALESETFSVTAKAACDCVVLCWPREAWPALTRAHPGLARATRRTIGLRTRELQDKIVDMATLPVEQRIANALLRLARQAGRETGSGAEIDFPLTRQDISELTGANMHSVSRYMSSWQKTGIVSSARRRVVIVRPDALREVAQGRAA
ncbi:MAG: Crp/Fnr family transcriptional regulator [Pseudomonadota bacterium]